jgi:hypothetical protein
MVARAREEKMGCWSGSSALFGRYDYHDDQFRLEEMLNDDFFGSVYAMLRKGDLITITDCEDQIMVVRVDYVDRGALKVWLSKIERLYAMPVVALDTQLEYDPGLVYRWRAQRGGGHSILAADGSVVAINFSSRQEAEKVIAGMYKLKEFAAPAGHEPVEPFVKEAKAFRPGRGVNELRSNTNR